MKYACSFEEARNFYAGKAKGVFGWNYLYQLVNSKDEVAIQRVFAGFMRKFLRKKYLIYMLRFGKMENREKYIEYKNKYILNIEDVILSLI